MLINAYDITKATLCSDLDAAIKAEELREKMVEEKKDFTFENVLSTERNLLLLQIVKENGYFVRCIYVLISSPNKIRSRYSKALALLPRLVGVCDVLHIYDNTEDPFRIFRKSKDAYYHCSNEYWSEEEIEKLCGISEYD